MKQLLTFSYGPALAIESNGPKINSKYNNWSWICVIKSNYDSDHQVEVLEGRGDGLVVSLVGLWLRGHRFMIPTNSFSRNCLSENLVSAHDSQMMKWFSAMAPIHLGWDEQMELGTATNKPRMPCRLLLCRRAYRSYDITYSSLVKVFIGNL